MTKDKRELKIIMNDFINRYLKKQKEPEEKKKIDMAVTEQFVDWLDREHNIKHARKIYPHHTLDFHLHCFAAFDTTFIKLLFTFIKYVQQVGEFIHRDKEEE